MPVVQKTSCASVFLTKPVQGCENFHGGAAGVLRSLCAASVEGLRTMHRRPDAYFWPTGWAAPRFPGLMATGGTALNRLKSAEKRVGHGQPLRKGGEARNATKNGARPSRRKRKLAFVEWLDAGRHSPTLSDRASPDLSLFPRNRGQKLPGVPIQSHSNTDQGGELKVLFLA